MNGEIDITDEIDQKYGEIQRADDYYDVLGVDSEASADDIRRAFRDLAKKWHADRFSDELDEDDQQKVREIFGALNSAHETLSDASRREEYDRALETGDVDIESVIDAESSFRRGRNLLDAGRFSGAHEKFERACELSPDDEPEYRAHRLYTEYQLIPKDEEGVPESRGRAEEIFNELDSIAEQSEQPRAWLFAFMGRVANGLRRNSQAEKLFERATSIDPDNTLARRQLRLIRMRRDSGEEGLIDRITSALPFLGD